MIQTLVTLLCKKKTEEQPAKLPIAGPKTPPVEYPKMTFKV